MLGCQLVFGDLNVKYDNFFYGKGKKVSLCRKREGLSFKLILRSVGQISLNANYMPEGTRVAKAALVLDFLGFCYQNLNDLYYE